MYSRVPVLPASQMITRFKLGLLAGARCGTPAAGPLSDSQHSAHESAATGSSSRGRAAARIFWPRAGALLPAAWLKGSPAAAGRGRRTRVRESSASAGLDLDLLRFYLADYYFFKKK